MTLNALTSSSALIAWVPPGFIRILRVTSHFKTMQRNPKLRTQHYLRA